MSPAIYELPETPPPDEERVVRAVPIQQIDNSPLRNRRTTADVEQMAETIKVRGVLQPGIVRPARGRFEIVLGQTRLEGARLAGLRAFPAFVRELSDEEVRAFYVIENLQRREMHPLDEADAYRKLRDDHGWTTERIAKETGSTLSTVRARLKLNELTDSLVIPYLEGKFSGVVALSIARIPGSDQQEKAAREVIRPGNSAGALSTAAALEHIKRNYVLTEGGAAMKPSDVFSCAVFRCRLTARGCVARQDERRRHAGSATLGIVHRPCGDGTCDQGKRIREALGDDAPAQIIRNASPAAYPKKPSPPHVPIPLTSLTIGAPSDTAHPSAMEEREASAMVSEAPGEQLTEESDPVLQPARLKRPSRQTVEWLAFTEKHSLEDVLDDPGYWGDAILKAAETLPFDTPGQRIAACLSAAAVLGIRAEGVGRGPFLRLAAGFFDALSRAQESEAA